MKSKSLHAVFGLAACFAFAIAAAGQGRYANVYSKRDVNNIIRTLENSSDVFSRDFRRYMDQSQLNGSPSEQRLNRVVENYENALDQLRRNFDRNNSWWASRDDVQDIMGEARNVNAMMNTLQFANRLERQWRNMRRDINKLADTYDLPDLAGGGGWNGGGGAGGDADRPPRWLVGTWYWVQGTDRQFAVDANGTVTEFTGGRTNYGTYRNGLIVLNGNESTVTRTANGIRTRNRTTGEISDYTGGNTGGGAGNTSRPPRWAIGTWFWIQGPDRRFSIDENGRVTEYTGGQVNYGTYYEGVITLNGNESTVTRTRDGIRTYNRATGETSDYRRQ